MDLAQILHRDRGLSRRLDLTFWWRSPQGSNQGSQKCTVGEVLVIIIIRRWCTAWQASHTAAAARHRCRHCAPCRHHAALQTSNHYLPRPLRRVAGNNSKTMFMVLSSWQSHCESSPGSFDECSIQVAADPRLASESACTISTHHRHLLLLLSPKADTHFTVRRRWVDLVGWWFTRPQTVTHPGTVSLIFYMSGQIEMHQNITMVSISMSNMHCDHQRWSPWLLLLVCVSLTITGQPRNSVLICRV